MNLSGGAIFRRRSKRQMHASTNCTKEKESMTWFHELFGLNTRRNAIGLKIVNVWVNQRRN